jgi:hypothetical protein
MPAPVPPVSVTVTRPAAAVVLRVPAVRAAVMRGATPAGRWCVTPPGCVTSSERLPVTLLAATPRAAWSRRFPAIAAAATCHCQAVTVATAAPFKTLPAIAAVGDLAFTVPVAAAATCRLGASVLLAAAAAGRLGLSTLPVAATSGWLGVSTPPAAAAACWPAFSTVPAVGKPG